MTKLGPGTAWGAQEGMEGDGGGGVGVGGGGGFLFFGWLYHTFLGGLVVGGRARRV